MSEPNQKILMIDKTQNLTSNFLRIDNDFIINAYSRLTNTGFGVYLYLVTRVPHTYDGKIPNKKKGNKPYELSPTDISKVINRHKKSVQTAIDELIKVGYITCIKGNLYQFKDYLPEDKIQSIEEYEMIKEFTIEESIKYQREQEEERLRNIAREKIVVESSREKYDWE